MEKLKQLCAAVVCRFKGHRKGKRIESLDNGATKRFSCPRCGRITSYKLKAA